MARRTLMTFGLSGRQRKALDGGQPLSIAVPAPAEDREWRALDYARTVIRDVDHASILSAEERLLAVLPESRAAGGALQQALGQLVGPDEPGHWRVLLLCVVAELQPARPRKPPADTQWAGGSIEIGR